MFKKLITILISLFVIGLGVVGYAILKTDDENYQESDQYLVNVPPSSLSLTSPAFDSKASIPSQYTCDGEDINPPMVISGVPPETKSLILMMEDLDVSGEPWLHWLVYDIDSTINQIPENGLPNDTKPGLNSFGNVSYGGPCPPVGEHRYSFKLFALDQEVKLPGGLRKEAIEIAMKDHVVGVAELVGVYGRK